MAHKQKSTRRHFLKTSSGLLVGGLVIPGFSCSRKTGAVGKKAPVPAQANYKIVNIQNPCTVEGKIRYEGKAPTPILMMSGRGAKTTKTVFESVQYADPALGTLKDAIVIIEGITQGKAWNSNEKPHAAVRRNLIVDRTDVFGLSKWSGIDFSLENYNPTHQGWALKLKDKQLFNKGVPPNAKTSIRIRKPGVYELLNPSQPWRRGFRIAVPHPYYAKTDSKGNFVIPEVPPGTYKVTIWAEGFSPTKMELKVTGKKVQFNPVLKEENLNEIMKLFLPKKRKKES